MVKSSIGKGEQGVEDYKRKIIELVQNSTNQENFDVYFARTFEIAVRFRKKKLLKRLYDLAVYLYLYEDGE